VPGRAAAERTAYTPSAGIRRGKIGNLDGRHAAALRPAMRLHVRHSRACKPPGFTRRYVLIGVYSWPRGQLVFARFWLGRVRGLRSRFVRWRTGWRWAGLTQIRFRHRWSMTK